MLLRGKPYDLVFQIGRWRHCGVVSLLEHRLWSSAGSQRQEVERLHLARSFGGDVKSCLADRCYARQIFQNLRAWMDERGVVAPLGAVVASTDGRTGNNDADLSPEDGSAVR